MKNFLPSKSFVALMCAWGLYSCKQKIEYGESGVPKPNPTQTAGTSNGDIEEDIESDNPPGQGGNNPPEVASTPLQDSDGSEISDACCFFPLAKFPTLSFNDKSMRAFGALRDKGSRKHAACDLYSSVGTTVYAVADGKVMDYYFFYSGTYALEVKHAKFVVRYGEVMGMAKGVSKGSFVKAGQAIARVGKLNCCPPMLHFEKFSGSVTGPLSNLGNPPYKRRKDLVNPTSDLLTWKSKLPK